MSIIANLKQILTFRVAPKQNSKYKTKLCDKYTTTGLCPYGSRCLFIHPDNGNNSYIRPDKLVEVNWTKRPKKNRVQVTQRHALADMNAQKLVSRPATPDSQIDPILGSASAGRRPQLRPHPSWPLEPANFFSDKNDEGPHDLKAYDFQSLFGCKFLWANDKRIPFKALILPLPTVFLWLRD